MPRARCRLGGGVLVGRRGVGGRALRRRGRPRRASDDAQEIADGIGYPVIIKAAAGGGGRGMTVVNRKEDLRNAYQTTRASAQAIFKDSAVYIERYLKTARHTEVQIVCDQYGAGIHL